MIEKLTKEQIDLEKAIQTTRDRQAKVEALQEGIDLLEKGNSKTEDDIKNIKGMKEIMMKELKAWKT